MLQGVGLRKGYGEGSGRVMALDGADVEVRGGELLAIQGPSGSGKTTLLHCLSGLTAPDEGRVLLEGADLAGLDDDTRTALRAERMAFVFQTLNLLPALTAAENVELPLVLAGVKASEIRERTAVALDGVGLADRADAYPRELSGGEQLRVAIARALISEPDILWADEPTGALDSASAGVVLDLLRSAVADGRTVVMVTHSAELAAAADRVVTMRDGRVEGAVASA
jgi:putative ABC transport system ATP-binding protein